MTYDDIFHLFGKVVSLTYFFQCVRNLLNLTAALLYFFQVLPGVL